MKSISTSAVAPSLFSVWTSNCASRAIEGQASSESPEVSFCASRCGLAAVAVRRGVFAEATEKALAVGMKVQLALRAHRSGQFAGRAVLGVDPLQLAPEEVRGVDEGDGVPIRRPHRFNIETFPSCEHGQSAV